MQCSGIKSIYQPNNMTKIIENTKIATIKFNRTIKHPKSCFKLKNLFKHPKPKIKVSSQSKKQSIIPTYKTQNHKTTQKSIFKLFPRPQLHRLLLTKHKPQPYKSKQTLSLKTPQQQKHNSNISKIIKMYQKPILKSSYKLYI